jgi:hypothetical protein
MAVWRGLTLWPSLHPGRVNERTPQLLTDQTTLTDGQYRIGARLNLNLAPLDPVRVSALPTAPTVSGWVRSATTDGTSCSEGNEPTSGSGEFESHHTVPNVLHRAVLTMGGQGVRETKHL